MARVTCSLVLLLVLVLSGQSARNVVDAQTDPHGYFNALVTRPEYWKSYSLRSAQQLATRSNGGLAQCDSCPLNITYDPANDPDPRRQDAAKLVVAAGNNDIGNQLYLPLGAGNGHTYFITWDAWWGAEFDYGNTGLATYKTWQIGQPSGSTSPCAGTHQWFEIQHRFSAAGGAAIAQVSARSYFPGADPVPSVGSFTVQPERWTRYWLLIDRTAAQSAVSLWAADTQTDPVLLIDRFTKTACSSLDNLWVEFNTSSAWVARPIGPLVAYLRNFVMLQDVVSPTTLLQRPNAGLPLPPPPTPTAPSAPRNLRIVSP